MCVIIIIMFYYMTFCVPVYMYMYNELLYSVKLLRYMYWSVDSSGLFRASLGELQSSECISGVMSEENVFSSSNLVDFVLEPDVYIYLASQQGIEFIGFDQQTNGSIDASNLAHLESYGDAIVTVFSNMFVRICNSSTVVCDLSVVPYMNSEYPAISDILTFRKSKQPLPGTLYVLCIYTCTCPCIYNVHYILGCTGIMYNYCTL